MSTVSIPISGGYCSGVPPLPIPNREVKPACADGTAMQCGRVGSRHFYLRALNPKRFRALSFCMKIHPVVPREAVLSLGNPPLLENNHGVHVNTCCFCAEAGSCVVYAGIVVILTSYLTLPALPTPESGVGSAGSVGLKFV